MKHDLIRVQPWNIWADRLERCAAVVETGLERYRSILDFVSVRMD